MRRTLYAFCLAALSALVWAGETPLTYDRVTLNASAETPVENDILVAVLFAQAEGPDASPLAAEVNGRIAKALETAKAAAGVKAQTLDYQTDPVYRNNRVDGWRVSQALRLESADAAALSELIGRLQQQLAVRSVGYEVSPEQWAAAENTLIGQAIAGFMERARNITQSFGKSDFRIVDVHIGAGGRPPVPRFYGGRAMAIEAAPAPPIEAGTQDVKVEVSGTIELR